MFRIAARRFRTSLVAVLSLLFAQLALANYLCPIAGATEQGIMEMAPGEPCQGMAVAQDRTVLCHQHCTDAPQSFEGVKLPALSVPVVLQVLLVPMTLDTATQQAAAFAGAGPEQPPPEPLFLSTLRLLV